MIIIRLLIISFLAILPFISMHQVNAQQATGGAFAIEEIVVTARRREESLQDTPIAVTAFTADEIDLRGALSVNDLAQATPNVMIESSSQTSGLTASPTIFMRGVGQSDFVINTDPAVGIYIDGVYVARSIGSMMDLVDLERAEVLRGPQGTLFGRNTLAGAVNLVTKRPNPEAFESKVSLSFGENSYGNLRASFNLPIEAVDDLAARVSIMQRSRGGYVKATSYDNLWLGDDNTSAVRAQLEFAPADSLRVNLTGDWSHNKAAPAPLVPAALYSADGTATGEFVSILMQGNWWNVGTPMGGASFSGVAACATAEGRNTNPLCYGEVHNPGVDVYETGAIFYDVNGNRDYTPENWLTTYGTALTVETETSLGTLRSITAYRGFKSSFMNDHDYSPIPIFSNINDDFHQDGRSQEIQLTGQAMDGRLDYTTGIYHFKETGTEVVSLIGVNGAWVTQGRKQNTSYHPGTVYTGMSGMNAVHDDAGGLKFQRIVRDIDNTSNAVFAQLTYHISDRLHLTGGVRSTTDDKTFDVTIHRDYCPADASKPQPAGGPTSNGDGRIERDKVRDICEEAVGSASWTQTDPMLSLVYDISDTAMIYGSFAKGFRDGGFASRFPEGMPQPMPAFAPEYVTNYEIGAKADLFGGALRLNGAIFNSTYDDMQVNARPAGLFAGGTGIENVGVGVLTGAELEALLIVSDTLRIDATVGLLDAKVDSLVGNAMQSGNYLWYGPGYTDATLSTPLVSKANCPTTVCTPLAEAVLPYAPENNYTLGITHRLPLGGGGNITTRIDYIHMDAQRFKFEPHMLMREDAYNIANFNTTYNSADEDWSVTFGVRNATNEVYSSNGSFSTGNGNAAVNLNRPRESYVRYQHYFGN